MVSTLRQLSSDRTTSHGRALDSHGFNDTVDINYTEVAQGATLQVVSHVKSEDKIWIPESKNVLMDLLATIDNPSDNHLFATHAQQSWSESLNSNGTMVLGTFILPSPTTNVEAFSWLQPRVQWFV